MNRLLLNLTLAVALLSSGISLLAQPLTENFNDITTLAGSGWVTNNLSSPIGLTGWSQGDATVFPAFSGATNAYISANFNNTANVGTISNWLISPQRTLNNGDVISFYTRTVNFPAFPDRLELRLSLAGASTNVGTTATSVGDFTQLVLTVNFSQTTSGYPSTWTLFSYTVSGLSGPTSGRIALRYFVTNAGPNGANSDYIGIDDFSYTPFVAAPANDNCSGATPIPVNSSCIPVNGDVAGATQSMPAASCNGATGTANNDVWFSFVATQTNVSISVTGSAQFDAVVQLFSGSCGMLNSLSCADASFEGGVEQIQFATLAIGATYYVRVYDYYATIPATTAFTICAVSFVPCNLTIPSNAVSEGEACGGDTNGGCNMPTPVYTDMTCGQTRSGTSYAAGATRDTDWYRFTLNAPATVTFNCNSEFPGQFFLVDNCTNLTILGSAFTAPCVPAQISTSLGVGTYILVVTVGDAASGYFEGFPCSSNMDYFFTYNLSTVAPTVSPAGPVALCPGASTTLSSSMANSYAWTGGGSGQTLSVSAPGDYSVTVVDANGCSVASAPVSVVASQIPSASISGVPQGGCSESAVTLNSNSTAGSGSIQSYVWYLNGSAQPSSNTETYVASQTGSYSVMVTNSNNCTFTTSPVTLNIGALPSAIISGDASVCSPASAQLSASANGGAGTIIGYQWILNGQNVNNAQSSSYAAAQGGTYSVQVSNSLGCSSVSPGFDVAINALPTVSIAGSNILCPGGEAQLVANSTAGSGMITTHTWFLGGNELAGNGANYVATETGSYTVQVTNSANCSATSAAFVISAASAPTASFTSGVQNGVATFFNTSSNAISYSWNFGDGSAPSLATNPIHTYTQSGIYTVTLTATDACGSTSSFEVELNVEIISVQEVELSNHVLIYPSPAGNTLNVAFTGAISGAKEWTITDQTGRRIDSANIIQSGVLSFDISHLASGNYMFTIIADQGRIAKRFVKQ